MTQSLAAAGTAAQVVLTGDLARPSRLTVADLRAWPQRQVAVSFECATSGTRRHRFTGEDDLCRGAGGREGLGHGLPPPG